jgi:anti-sigma regulatory factor (Ser/Thr protein kinase)
MQSLTVAATLDSLEPISQFVLAASKSAGLSEKPTYRLRLAVDEIVTNIIMHGYAETGHTGELFLTFSTQRGSLIFTIEDTAPPFDPRHHPAPDLNLPIEQRPMGGLGVFLALHSVDQYGYEWDGSHNRNILTMFC